MLPLLLYALDIVLELLIYLPFPEVPANYSWKRDQDALCQSGLKPQRVLETPDLDQFLITKSI